MLGADGALGTYKLIHSVHGVRSPFRMTLRAVTARPAQSMLIDVVCACVCAGQKFQMRQQSMVESGFSATQTGADGKAGASSPLIRWHLLSVMIDWQLANNRSAMI